MSIRVKYSIGLNTSRAAAIDSFCTVNVYPKMAVKYFKLSYVVKIISSLKTRILLAEIQVAVIKLMQFQESN